MTRNAVARVQDGAPPWAEGLNDRERAFVEQYVVDLNPTEAAVRAGLGKTRKSSTEIASRMRKTPKVAEAISRLMTERSGVTGAAVLNEIGRIAFAKFTDFARIEGGQLVITDTSKLTEDQMAAIAEISETVGEGGRTIKIKLHDKLHALDRMARALGLYKERVEMSGPNGGPIQVEDAVARLRERVEAMARRKEGEVAVEIQPPLKRIAAATPQPAVRIIDAKPLAP